MSYKCDRGPIFHVTNLNRNLTQFRPSESHCQPDPTGRNCSLGHVTTKICVDRLEKQPKKAGFSSGQAWNSNTEISIGKSMCCCILVWAHYWSRKGRNKCPDRSTWFGKRKEIIENRDKLKITKYLIFSICFCQRETFFTHLINSKLISEIVSSGNTVFLRINATQVWRILIGLITIAHAQLQNSVNKALNTKKELTQTSNETK